MLKKISALVLLFLLGGCANNVPYAEWTPKEKKLYKYQLALQAIDTIQTGQVINCQKNNQCLLAEANPIYGKRPSMGKLLGIKVASNILVYQLLSKKTRHRELTLKFMNTTLILTVTQNQIVINKAL
tara:strand:+ start:79 stop:459 length:381 start_codon:yes stop_codon:yes gene_type:complete